ncbi:MAG TPA: hypothetical protein VE988_17645 [Gemmataceae bacterium]|nr:hypothetical protein [Gemmataceae bacterium]
MTETNGYQHLERRPGSNYKQLFVKGRRIRAEVLYRQTVGSEPMTPEEVAEDYELALEVVQEAIDYCLHHPEVLQEDFDRESAKVREFERVHPPVLPAAEQLDP